MVYSKRLPLNTRPPFNPSHKPGSPQTQYKQLLEDISGTSNDFSYHPTPILNVQAPN